MRRFGHVSLIYNRTGQVVSFYPPDAEVIGQGAPATAATYAIWAGTASNDDAALLTGSATLDAVDTTVDAVSGYSEANRARLYVAATTGAVIGERYLVSNTNGQREIVQLAAIISADRLDLEEDLSFDYPITSSALEGLRHYFTIDATFIQSIANINVWGNEVAATTLGGAGSGASTMGPPYRVRWVYTTGSTTRESWTTFDVVRKPAKANLSIADLRSVAPDVAYLEPLSQHGQDWAPQLVRAEMDVALDLRANGADAAQIIDPEFYDRLVLWRWVVNIGQVLWMSTDAKPDWYDTFRSEYQQLREKYTGTGNKAWRDVGTAGQIAVNPPGNLWLK